MTGHAEIAAQQASVAAMWESYAENVLIATGSDRDAIVMSRADFYAGAGAVLRLIQVRADHGETDITRWLREWQLEVSQTIKLGARGQRL